MEDVMVIIAVDDERLAVDSIIKSIRSVAPGAEVYGFRSGVSVLDFLESHPADVAFRFRCQGQRIYTEAHNG